MDTGNRCPFHGTKMLFDEGWFCTDCEQKEEDDILERGKKEEREEILKFLEKWEPTYTEEDEANWTDGTYEIALPKLYEAIKNLEHKK